MTTRSYSRPGFITSTYVIACARCERSEADGPRILGVSMPSSATRYAYFMRKEGWQYRVLTTTAADGSLVRSKNLLWICPDCAVAEGKR